MKLHLSTEFKVGLLITIGIILLIIGIIAGQNYRVSSGKKDITFVFPNSGGIKISEPIVVNGVTHGNVKSIQNYKDSVLIIASVDKNLDIRSDATARITILEVTGGKKIELHPGSNPTQYNPQNYIIGSTPPDIQELIAIIGTASGNLEQMLVNIANTLSSVNKLMSDDTLISNLKNTIASTNSAVTKLNNLLGNNYANLDQTIKDLHSITNNLNKLIVDNKSNVNSISNNLDTLLRDSKPMITKANRLFDSLNVVVSDLKQLTNDLNSGDGLAARLINDKELSKKLDSTLLQLDTLLNQIIRYGINTNIRLGTRP